MKPHEAFSQYRELIRAAVARYPLVNPRVFGSVATGRDTDNSDLDLLVDVLMPGDLPSRFRDSVVREAVPL